MGSMSLDFEKVCRLCFRDDAGQNRMISMYGRPDLEETIQKCVQIEVKLDNKEPANICESCVLCLDSWNKFKMLCDSTDAFIQYNLQSNESDLMFNSEVTNLGALNFTPSQMSPISNLSFGFFESDSLWSDMLQQFDEVDPTCTDLLGPSCATKIQPPEDVHIDDECGKECIGTVVSVLSKKDDNLTFKKPYMWNSKNISMQKENRLLHKQKFTSTTDISKAMSKYNRYVRKIYNCDICPAVTFTKFNDLIVHDLEAHKAIPNNFRCKECGKSFLSNGRLQIHMKVHRAKLFECNMCQKKFALQKTLDKHLNVHMALFNCQTCDYKAPSLYTLKIHEDTHSLVKKHLCQECKKSFATRSSLYRHNRLTHQKAALYQCDQCNYATAIATKLKFHKSIHTPDSFICHHCGCNFKNQDLLRLHSKKHMEFELKCQHCTKTFRRKANLMVHLSKSHNLGPIIKRVSKCDICDRSFSRNKILRKHKVKCHPQISDILNNVMYN